MWRASSVLSIAAIALIAIQDARSAETSALPAEVKEVIVTGESMGSLTSASPEESAKQKTQFRAPSQSRRPMTWISGVHQTSKICCNERHVFSFNRKTAPSPRPQPERFNHRTASADKEAHRFTK
jgi:hypothetical protein